MHLLPHLHNGHFHIDFLKLYGLEDEYTTICLFILAVPLYPDTLLKLFAYKEMQRFQHSKCDVMRHYVAHLSYDVDRVDDRLMDINYKRMVHFYDGYSVGGMPMQEE